MDWVLIEFNWFKMISTEMNRSKLKQKIEVSQCEMWDDGNLQVHWNFDSYAIIDWFINCVFDLYCLTKVLASLAFDMYLVKNERNEIIYLLFFPGTVSSRCLFSSVILTTCQKKFARIFLFSQKIIRLCVSLIIIFLRKETTLMIIEIILFGCLKNVYFDRQKIKICNHRWNFPQIFRLKSFIVVASQGRRWDVFWNKI